MPGDCLEFPTELLNFRGAPILIGSGKRQTDRIPRDLAMNPRDANLSIPESVAKVLDYLHALDTGMDTDASI